MVSKPVELVDMDERLELAWAAGFFDGEGCLSGAQWPKLTVVQTDRRPLERFQVAVGGRGQISARPRSMNPAHKDQFAWETGRFEHVQDVICKLWPFLSEPKKEQIHRVILAARARRPILPTGMKRRDQKITWAIAEDIRRRLATGESGAAIARSLGLSQTAVSQINVGKRWVA